SIARTIQQVEERLSRGPSPEKPARTPQALPTSLPDLPEKLALLAGLGLLRKADAALEALPLEQKGTVVRIPLQVPSLAKSNLFLGSSLCLAAITTLGTNANKTFTSVGTTIGGTGGPGNDLKKLAQALDKYHSAHGHFPPAARFDKDG